MGERDPIEHVLGASEDLYDVATWDPRSPLDRVSVSLYHGLHTTKRVVLVLLAVALFAAQLAFAVAVFGDDPRLGVLALGSALPAFALVGYVWWRDPTRREPFETLAITFVLAVLFASFAALVNGVFGLFLRPIPVVGFVLYYFLVVGPVEETVKWLAIRTYAFNHGEFSAVIDGAVYGAVAGLGFATIENAVYIARGYAQAADAATAVAQIQVATQTAAGRAFVGPGHVLYSAFAGYYLGLAKFNPEDAGPIVVKGIAIAAVLHATYNTLVTVVTGQFSGIVPFLAFVLVFDGVVAYALYRKLSRYWRYYDRANAQTPEEADAEAAESG